MKRINYKSDFDFILRLSDARGNDVGWPAHDWEAKLRTSWNTALVVSCRGGKPTNCFNDGGRIHAVAKGHRLGCGILKAEITSWLPDGDYPGGSRALCAPQPLGIELVGGPGDCPSAIEAEMVLPYIKGEPFTYADFTPGQIEELQRPAKEAADAVNALAADERRAERQRVEAEEKRMEAETLRASAEATRADSERQRVADERARVEAEDERREAERQRAETFAGYADVIGTVNGKADREELSNVLAADPLAQWEAPEMPAYRRLFIDMWTALLTKNADGSVNKRPKGGYFPEREHPFVCNGVEMDFDEALEVYLCSMSTQKVSTNRSYAFAGRTRLRTVLPIIILSSGFNVGFDASYMFFMCQNLEVIDVKGHYGNNDSESLSLNNAIHTFSGCRKLRKIIPCINLYGNYSTASMFSGCESLETCTIRSYNTSVSLAHSPNWSMDSLSRSINARPSSYTKTITFTLHPDAYARVTEDLFEAAANKNITIATI